MKSLQLTSNSVILSLTLYVLDCVSFTEFISIILFSIHYPVELCTYLLKVLDILTLKSFSST